MNLTSEQLSKQMPAFAYGQFWDNTYAEPTLAWLRGPFWNWFLTQRWKLGLKDYTRRNDCDNFARAWAQGVQDCWGADQLAQGKSPAEGIAAGVFVYHSDKLGGNHAIGVASIGGKLVFTEPQNNAGYDLTEKEIASCFFYEF